MSQKKKPSVYHPEEEDQINQKPMNKLKGNGPPHPNLSFIHAFGDIDNFLSYSIEDQVWTSN